MAGHREQVCEQWRELALRIQYETDPVKVIELAQQLITKLDEEQSSRFPERSTTN